jgi:hypothetical protein
VFKNANTNITFRMKSSVNVYDALETFKNAKIKKFSMFEEHLDGTKIIKNDVEQFTIKLKGIKSR